MSEGPSARRVPRPIGLEELVESWDGVLLDAYGVLNDGTGALPGAARLLDLLDGRKRPWRVVTNDASRLPQATSRRFAGWGLDVPPERVLSSGSLVPGWLRARGFDGGRVAVLGPPDSREWVRRGGGVVVPASEDFEVLVVADEAGFDLLPTLDAVVSSVFRRLDRGGAIALVLPNPDLVYPSGSGSFGITAGAIAATIEAALADRYGDEAPRFERLGKPASPLFEEARRQIGDGRLVMVGDQVTTDVRGARAAGIDAVLALPPERRLAAAVSERDVPDRLLEWSNRA